MNITIILKRKEIVDDVLVRCNMIARSLIRNSETEDLGDDLMTPDDRQTKPIVARALPEAFGEIKRICQKYLLYGRSTDDNRLERIDETNRYSETILASPLTIEGKYRMLTGIPYQIKASADTEVKIMDNEGTILARGTEVQFSYTPVRMNEYLTLYSTEKTEVSVEYEWGDFGKYEICLDMPPRFNIGITETVKSCAHKMMVDYVMFSVLKDQYAEKAKEYASQFASDQEALKNALISRTSYSRSYAADWS